MNLYSFLAGLPPVIAAVVFIAYQFLRSRASQGITERIVAKLRVERPDRSDEYVTLKPAQLERTLTRDQELKRLVDRQDFVLLQQTLRQEFIASLVVNIVVVVLILAGIVLFTLQANRKPPLTVKGLHIESSIEQAGGLAVDLDPLRVTWTTEGTPEDVMLFLENIQTGRRTVPIRVPSSKQSAVINPTDYTTLLEKRNLGDVNGIRVSVQTAEALFHSDETPLHVGMSLLVLATPTDGSSSASVSVTPLIDRARVQNYDFQALVYLFRKQTVADGIGLGPAFTPQTKPKLVDRPDTIDWARTKVIYLAPNDKRLIRHELLVDDFFK